MIYLIVINIKTFRMLDNFTFITIFMKTTPYIEKFRNNLFSDF